MKEYNFKINGNDYSVAITGISDEKAEVMVNGTAFDVEFGVEGAPRVTKPQTAAAVNPIQVNPQQGAPAAATAPPAVAAPAPASSPASPLKSPLPGVIIDTLVRVGDTVKEGQHLVILEAMKMENNIDSHRAGVVKSINVTRGDSVLEGDVLLTIE